MCIYTINLLHENFLNIVRAYEGYKPICQMALTATFHCWHNCKMDAFTRYITNIYNIFRRNVEFEVHFY